MDCSESTLSTDLIVLRQHLIYNYMDKQPARLYKWELDFNVNFLFGKLVIIRRKENSDQCKVVGDGYAHSDPVISVRVLHLFHNKASGYS